MESRSHLRAMHDHGVILVCSPKHRRTIEPRPTASDANLGAPGGHGSSKRSLNAAVYDHAAYRVICSRLFRNAVYAYPLNKTPSGALIGLPYNFTVYYTDGTSVNGYVAGG